MVRASVPETNDTPLGLDDCECEVRPVKGTKRIVEIVYCPKHAATDDLLAACKAATIGLNELKEQYSESQGDWVLADFLAAATDEGHWMHKVVQAETALGSVIARAGGQS